MGSPGCGKTTAAEAVGDQLGLTVIDVDEYLERHWKTSVANKVHINNVSATVHLLTAHCLHKRICVNWHFRIYFGAAIFDG